MAVEAREVKTKEFTDFHMPLNIGGMNGKMSLGKNLKYTSNFPKFPVKTYRRRCITHARSGIFCQYEFVLDQQLQHH